MLQQQQAFNASLFYQLLALGIYLVVSIVVTIYTLIHYTKKDRLNAATYITLFVVYLINFFSLAYVTIDLSAGYIEPQSPAVCCLQFVYFFVARAVLVHGNFMACVLLDDSSLVMDFGATIAELCRFGRVFNCSKNFGIHSGKCKCIGCIIFL